MTKREFFHRLRKFKHPGRIELEQGRGMGCDYIYFYGQPIEGEGRQGGFDVQYIQNGDYSKRRFWERPHGGYQESSSDRGKRLLAKYQRWYDEWLKERQTQE